MIRLKFVNTWHEEFINIFGANLAVDRRVWNAPVLIMSIQLFGFIIAVYIGAE